MASSISPNYNTLKILDLPQEMFEKVISDLPREILENISKIHLKCNQPNSIKRDFSAKITCFGGDLPARVWENRATVNILLKQWLQARHDLTHAINGMNPQIPRILWEKRGEVNSQLGYLQEANDDYYHAESSEFLKLPQELFEEILSFFSWHDVIRLEQCSKNLINRTANFWSELYSPSKGFQWTTEKQMSCREISVVSYALFNFISTPKVNSKKFDYFVNQYPFFGAYVHQSEKKFEIEEKRLRECPRTGGEFLLQGLFFLQDYMETATPELPFEQYFDFMEKIGTSMTNAILKKAIATPSFLMQALYSLVQADPKRSKVFSPHLFYFVADFKSKVFKDSSDLENLKTGQSFSTEIANEANAVSFLIFLGERNLDKNNFTVALNHLCKARLISHDKDHRILLLCLKALEGLEDWKKVLKITDRLLSKSENKESPQFRYYRGLANYHLRQNSRQALTDLNFAIEPLNKQTDPNMRHIIGHLNIRLENFPQALVEYNRVIADFGDSAPAEIFAERGVLNSELRNLQQAKDDFDRAKRRSLELKENKMIWPVIIPRTLRWLGVSINEPD